MPTYRKAPALAGQIIERMMEKYHQPLRDAGVKVECLFVAHIARVQPAAAGQVASELRALAAAGQVAEIDGEWVRQYPVAQVIEPDAVPAGLLF